MRLANSPRIGIVPGHSTSRCSSSAPKGAAQGAQRPSDGFAILPCFAWDGRNHRRTNFQTQKRECSSKRTMPLFKIVVFCNDHRDPSRNIFGRNSRTTILFQHEDTPRSIRLRTRILTALPLPASSVVDSSHPRGMLINIPTYSSAISLRRRTLAMSNVLKGFDVRKVERQDVTRWVISIHHPNR